MTDPRDGKRVALKKMPNVFQNLISCKRVYRELKMLCHFKHDNVSSIKHSSADFLSGDSMNPLPSPYPIYHIYIKKIKKSPIHPHNSANRHLFIQDSSCESQSRVRWSTRKPAISYYHIAIRVNNRWRIWATRN